MLIDLKPIRDGEAKLDAYAEQFDLEDLRAAANASIDLMLEIIGDADDMQVTFIPDDPLADDEHAPADERYKGWSLAHLVVHVTATAEEWAAYSGILARGVAYPHDPRLRYETDWHTVTTRQQVLQRLEESRRIRLSSLSMWPDEPHFDVYRDVSDRYFDKYGKQNAKTTFLMGLVHESAHYDQLREAARQAREAAKAAV